MNNQGKLLLSTREAAEVLGVCHTVLYRWIKDGSIKRYKKPGDESSKKWIRRKDLDTFIDAMEVVDD